MLVFEARPTRAVFVATGLGAGTGGLRRQFCRCLHTPLTDLDLVLAPAEMLAPPARSRSFARKADADRFMATVQADLIRGDWTDPRLSKITVEDRAERWLRTKSHLKPKTLAGYLPSNPVDGVRTPRQPEPSMLFLDADQVDRLAMSIREPYGTLVYLLAYGGLRWGEAAALRR